MTENPQVHCQNCDTENRDGARFCAQCGTHLQMACASCNSVLPAGARFCDACGAAATGDAPAPSAPPARPAAAEHGTPTHLAREILHSRHALEGERKQVSVLFADIQGSTELIDGMDAEQAVRLMEPTLQAMMDAVHQFGGTVNRVQGDGIMALFGAPIAHEDHAARCCHAALAIMNATPPGGLLPVRVGLNTGEVVVRSINNDLTMEYEADGPTVHLAARMEQMAEPGTVLLTADTFRLVQGIVTVDSLGRIPVKGMSSPVPVFALRDVRTGRASRNQRPGDTLSPFVGRESELAALERALARTADQHGQVVAISGEAGVGKSRLVSEFVTLAEEKGWMVRLTGGDPLAVTTSYQPIITLLKSLFDVDDTDDAAALGVKTTEAVLALDPALAPIIPALHAVLGAPIEDPSWHGLSPEERRRRIIDATCTLTLRRAEALHLLMVFEDLHWIDAQTQAVLDALVDGLGGSRLMLLVSHRPEYKEGWSGKSYYTRLRVDPLEALTADEFLGQTLGHDTSLEQVKRLLVERTQGVPFFLEESICGLIETGHLSGTPGAYRCASAVEALEVPATVQAVLAARIDRLRPAHKELLQIAAVIGRNVSLPVLESVAEIPSSQLVDTLAELQSSEFLYRTASLPEQSYAFKHILTREVAYASLLREVRRRIHARLIRVIEERFTTRLDEHVAVLGHHALEAEQWDKADRYLARAAERATERSAYHEVIGLLDQQLDALARLPQDQAVLGRAFAVHLQLRSAHGAAGDVSKMIVHLRTARSMAADIGDELCIAQLEILATSVVNLYTNAAQMIASVRAGRDIVRNANDISFQYVSALALPILISFAGQFAEAAGETRAALRDASSEVMHERFGMTATWGVAILAMHAISEAHLGRFDSATRASDESEQIASTTQRPFDQGIALWTAGAVALWRGDLQSAISSLQRGFDVCDAESVGILMPNLAPTLAYALCLDGRIDAARELIEPWLDPDEDAAMFWFHGWGVAFRGLAGVMVGEHERAQRYLERIRELVRDCGLDGLEPELERALAVSRAAGSAYAPQQVEQDLQRAMGLAESQGNTPEVAWCLLEMGRHALTQGHVDRGRARLADAREHFTASGLSYWAKAADELIRSHPETP